MAQRMMEEPVRLNSECAVFKGRPTSVWEPLQRRSAAAAT